MPINLLFENPSLFIAWVIAIVVAITVHEFSHVFAAFLQGDSTGKSLGRLNLNPFRHIDPLGFILLIVAGFGWGRPAPFNPQNLKHPRLGTILVAFAGPISNFIAVLVFGLLFRFGIPALGLPDDNLLSVFLVFLVQVNIVLMLFNLIPIPPLDGSRVLLGLISDRYAAQKAQFEQYGPWLLLFLVLFGRGVFSYLFSLMNLVAFRVLGG